MGEVWEAVKGTTCLHGYGTAHLALWNHVRSLEHLRAGWALLPPSQSLSWLLPARLPGRAGGWPACSRPPISSAAHLSLLAAGPCSETSQPCQTAVGCMLQQRASLHLRRLCGTKFFLLLPLSAWDEDQFLHSAVTAAFHSMVWERVAWGGGDVAPPDAHPLVFGCIPGRSFPARTQGADPRWDVWAAVMEPTPPLPWGACWCW